MGYILLYLLFFCCFLFSDYVVLVILDALFMVVALNLFGCLALFSVWVFLRVCFCVS